MSLNLFQSRTRMRSKNMNSIVVHISSWHTKWIIGGIFREASEACSIKPTWRVYSNSKRDVLNLYVLKSRINPAVGQLNIYAHQDTYFSIFSTMPAQITNTRNRVFSHISMKVKLQINNKSIHFNTVRRYWSKMKPWKIS